jgi:ribosomal protein S18 acetylase RimI-like enzyme
MYGGPYPQRRKAGSRMRPAEILDLFDREMRRDPVPDPGSHVERSDSVVRVVGEDNYVLWSDLTEDNAARVVAEQVDRFRRVGAAFEWKIFGYDRPANLGAILAEAGFAPGALETLVAFDLENGPPAGSAPEGIRVRWVTDEAGVHDAVTATISAFESDDGEVLSRYQRLLRNPSNSVLVAYAAGRPVSAGRLEMTPGRSFASLWGGGTAPEYRNRGIYRYLVRARAIVAHAAGYRFLTVDAEETSRPILEQLGFVPLSTTRAWNRPAGARPSSEP